MRTVSHQYSIVKQILPGKGDTITELNFLRALAVNHKVTSAMDTDDADVSFIRANTHVFNRQKGIRCWMASPFNYVMYKQADYIYTFTDTWTKMLREGTLSGSLNPEKVAWGEKVITVSQVVSPEFKFVNTRKVTVYPFNSMDRPSGPVVGIFGRLAKSTYPLVIYRNIEYIKKRFPGIMFIIGSSGGAKDIPAPARDCIIVHKYPYVMMPQIYNACDAVLVSQRGFEWEFCGSLKTLEPAACGTPVICEGSSARREMLGDDYPLFLTPGSLEKANQAGAQDFCDRLEHALGQYDMVKRQELSKFITDKYGLKVRAEELKTQIQQL